MEWVILFIISWVLFISLVDWKQIKTHVWCGLLAMAMQMGIDSQAMHHKLYEVKVQVIDLWGSSLFFVMGPVLVIGILLSQFQPSKKWRKLWHILVIAALFSLQELFLILSEVLIYTNWQFINSVIVNIGAMIVLSWFSIVILDQGNHGKLKG